MWSNHSSIVLRSFGQAFFSLVGGATIVGEGAILIRWLVAPWGCGIQSNPVLYKGVLL